MRIDLPFTTPEAPLEKKVEMIEKKQKIRRELPEKSFAEDGKNKKSPAGKGEKEKEALPPDPLSQKGGKIDVSA